MLVFLSLTGQYVLVVYEEVLELSATVGAS